MVTKTQIIEQIAKEKEYLSICRKIARGNDIYKDLFQETIEVLLKMDEARLIGMHQRNELKWYVVMTISGLFNRERSSFYKAFRQYEKVFTEVLLTPGTHELMPFFDKLEKKLLVDESDYDFEIDMVFEKVNTLIEQDAQSEDKDLWFKGRLFKEYIKYESGRETARKTKLAVRTVTKSIRDYKRELIERLK